MTEFRRRPVEVTDSPEHRAIPIDSFQLQDSDDNTLTLTGYASTFEDYEMYGGPSNGQGWIERIDRGAYERTLKESPDLHLLINHEGMPLARTKSGTLDLSVDDRGLKVVARLDRSDPDVQRLEPKMRRGDMDEMSFAFRVKSQDWDATPEFKDDPQALRTITELSLHKGDVSVVNFGANPTTHAELKSLPDALRMLAECDTQDLVEARASNDVLQRAKDKLANVGILDTADDPALPVARSGITIPVRARLVDVDVFSLDEVRAIETRATNVNELIASLDAVLDEAYSLIPDIDEKSLPENVAQALDLLRGAWTIVGKLMEVAGIYDPDANDPGERMSTDETEIREEGSDSADVEPAATGYTSSDIDRLISVLERIERATVKTEDRDDTEELDDEMCADTSEEDQEESDEEDDEDNSRGMSLSEARSQESTLSLAELSTLE